jgi:hypothetical protein
MNNWRQKAVPYRDLILCITKNTLICLYVRDWKHGTDQQEIVVLSNTPKSKTYHSALFYAEGFDALELDSSREALVSSTQVLWGSWC